MRVLAGLALAAAVGFLPAGATAQSGSRWFEGEAPGATEALRDMLGTLPAILMQPAEYVTEIGFGDLAAARGLPVWTSRLPEDLRIAARAWPAGRLAQELGATAQDWPSSVGFGLGDVERVLSVGQIPRGGHVIDLSPEAAARVPAALAASGYALEEQLGLTAWAVGEDGRIDLARRRAEDPFVGLLGAAARVQIDGTRLRQANSWAFLAALAQPGPLRASEAPHIAPLLAMLEGLEAGPLLRAALIPDATGATLADPRAVVITGAMPEARQVWRALLIADFSTGPQSTGVMVLSLDWPAGADTEPLVQEIARRWAETPGPGDVPFAQRLGPLDIAVRQAPGGLLAVRLSVTGPTSEGMNGLPSNRAYDDFYRALMQRGLVFLP